MFRSSCWFLLRWCICLLVCPSDFLLSSRVALFCKLPFLGSFRHVLRLLGSCWTIFCLFFFNSLFGVWDGFSGVVAVVVVGGGGFRFVVRTTDDLYGCVAWMSLASGPLFIMSSTFFSSLSWNASSWLASLLFPFSVSFLSSVRPSSFGCFARIWSLHVGHTHTKSHVLRLNISNSPFVIPVHSFEPS